MAREGGDAADREPEDWGIGAEGLIKVCSLRGDE